jgi:hypothetical protein
MPPIFSIILRRDKEDSSLRRWARPTWPCRAARLTSAPSTANRAIDDSSSRRDWIFESCCRRGHVTASAGLMKRISLLILLLLGVPLPSQAQEERIAVRLITVRTEAKATKLRTQYQAGAPNRRPRQVSPVEKFYLKWRKYFDTRTTRTFSRLSSTEL